MFIYATHTRIILDMGVQSSNGLESLLDTQVWMTQVDKEEL